MFFYNNDILSTLYIQYTGYSKHMFDTLLVDK